MSGTRLVQDTYIVKAYNSFLVVMYVYLNLKSLDNVCVFCTKIFDSIHKYVHRSKN